MLFIDVRVMLLRVNPSWHGTGVFWLRYNGFDLAL